MIRKMSLFRYTQYLRNDNLKMKKKAILALGFLPLIVFAADDQQIPLEGSDLYYNRCWSYLYLCL